MKVNENAQIDWIHNCIYDFLISYWSQIFKQWGPVYAKDYTVEPRYKEVGYNKTLLEQGHFAGPSSLYFFVFLP